MASFALGSRRPCYVLVVLAAVMAALVLLSSTLAAAHDRSRGAGAPATVARAHLLAPGHRRAALPLAARVALSAALGRDQPAYAVRRWPGGGLGADNARGRLHISFSHQGATVVSRGDRVSFGLAGIRPVAPTVAANRVSYHYPGLTEWFANGPAGLEQGFTVTRPRSGNRLTVPVATAGNHAARQAGNVVQFGGAKGLGYGGLIATDRRGRRLPARLTVNHDRVRISVDVSRASYPVTIDPTINQTAELNAAGSASLGSSVAMSGSTVVVGDPGSDTANGRVYVYTEPAGGWQNTSQAAAVLSPSDPPNPNGANGPNNFGGDVAIDGSTIVVGATGANGGDGSAYVYDEPAGGWHTTNQQTKELNLGKTGAASGSDDFGVSVAVSGPTIAIGADGTGPDGNGAVYLVNASTLTEEQEIQPPNSPFPGQYQFGASVAISGSTLVVGATGQGNDGTVYIYNGLSSPPVTVGGSGSSQTFGSSVATNGSTVAVGAPGDGSNGAGVVELYNTAGQPAGVIADPNGQGIDDFGTSVAISGSTVAVGADQAAANSSASPGNGLAFAFTTTGQELAQLTYTDPSGNPAANRDDFGTGVAASPNGIAVGADGHGAGGSAYVYAETLTAAVAGDGTITSSDGQISCPGNCSATYIPGAQVTLGATPAAGSVFTGWSGACSGTGACQVTMDQAQSVTASFAAATHPTRGTSPPVNTSPPTITGSPTVGSQLTCSPGRWAGSPASYSYAWERNSTPIPGATMATYTTTAADGNTTLTCVVTATNAAGSASARSAGFAVTVPAASTPAAGRLTLSAGRVIGHSRLLFNCTASQSTLSSCTIEGLVHRRIVASGTARGSGSTAHVYLTLTRYGLKLLAQHSSGVRVAVLAAATGSVGNLTASRSVSLGMAQQELIPAAGMFGPNVPTLTPFGAGYLRSVAHEIQKAARVLCVGYTAAPGNWLHNTPFSLALSRARAQVGCKYLRRHQVSATYATEGLGKKDPLVPNTTPANLARNRRVEFRVISGLELKR